MPIDSPASPPAYVGAEAISPNHISHQEPWKPASRIPHAIKLRSSVPDCLSTKGTLKLHVPAWGVALVRPSTPQRDESLPGEDTIVSGSVEVVMAERRRCRGISVTMQGICKVWMGHLRGWEEDGIFERVVEVISDPEEGIWLEKGSQSFSFGLVLPSSLATHDCHKFGILTYHLMAHVRGSKNKPSLRGLLSVMRNGRGLTAAGWLDADLFVKRNMLVHAITDPAGVVQQLDLRREGDVDSLGPWRFAAMTDQWSIAAAFIFSLNLPSPSPRTTIFLVRLLLIQSYTVSSPRSPDDSPTAPEPTRSILLYQKGRPHPPGDTHPDHTAGSLWRGGDAGGHETSAGCEVETIIRLPTHEIVRPSTHEGTITPIRVTHHLELQIYYSIEGEKADRTPRNGPGELAMMQVRSAIMVPSCCCTISSLDLPPYTQSDSEGLKEFDQLFQTPAAQLGCMCGATLAELREPLERRLALRVGGVDHGEGSIACETGILKHD